MRVSSSQEEGANRDFSVLTSKFIGKMEKINGLVCNKVDADLKNYSKHGV